MPRGGAREAGTEDRRIMFDTVEDVPEERSDSVDDQGYICGKNIATVVYLAEKLEKPVLVEGPAGRRQDRARQGRGRQALGLPMIRLQCYEGLDESKALYEWEYSKQLLYTQMLRDKIGEVIEGAGACARRPSGSASRTTSSSASSSSCRGR